MARGPGGRIRAKLTLPLPPQPCLRRAPVGAENHPEHDRRRRERKPRSKGADPRPQPHDPEHIEEVQESGESEHVPEIMLHPMRIGPGPRVVVAEIEGAAEQEQEQVGPQDLRDLPRSRTEAPAPRRGVELQREVDGRQQPEQDVAGHRDGKDACARHIHASLQEEGNRLEMADLRGAVSPKPRNEDREPPEDGQRAGNDRSEAPESAAPARLAPTHAGPRSGSRRPASRGNRPGGW